MLLTGAEYERGLVTWAPQPGVTVELLTTEADGTQRSSGVLPDPAGSILPFPPAERFSYRLGLTAEGHAIGPGFWVKLEHVRSGVLLTHIWPTGQILRHVPDHSTFHRLVIDAAGLEWPEDRVLRYLTLLVRYVSGKIECERISPFAEMKEEADGNYTLAGGRQETATIEGRFIDIVAPGITPQRAELNARAILGLLALFHGPGVLGPIVSSESYTANEQGQVGRAVIPVAARAKQRIEDPEIGALHDVLDPLTVEGRIERARLLSLHWYERALRSTDAADTVLACFVGIEALITAYAAEHGPIPVETDRQRQYEELFRLAEPLGPAMIKRLHERLVPSSLTEQFAFYAEQRGLGAEVRTFRDIKDIRDRLIHGDQVEATADHLRAADRLLRKMLKDQFEITEELPWERLPIVMSVILEFEFSTAARRRAEKAGADPTTDRE